MIIRLLHLGIGNVGSELSRQITTQQKYLQKTLGIDLVYSGQFGLDHGVYRREGLTPEDIAGVSTAGNADPALVVAEIPRPFIVIDTTSSDDTLPLLRLALRRGGFVATANKRPLAGKQADYDALFKHGGNRLFFEPTVGAELPIISTLQDLINTGDTVERITGCFSGTLGYILSELENGTSFSSAVRQAKAKGFTERDPREDLSGADVARKVLILARLLGRQVEPAEIAPEPLFSTAMIHLSVNDFMKQLKQLDADYARQVMNAKKSGHVLRYVASVTPKACSVGLQEVSCSSDIGALRGPDNMVVIQTKRYHDNPLVIKGPGAGVPVTAAAVLADIIKAAQRSKE